MKLVCTADQLRTLREWTIQDDGKERFAYLYCTRTGDDTLLAREAVPVRDDDCDVQATTAVRPSLEVERERIGACLSDGLVPVLVHSHPFAAEPEFSSRDDDVMTALADWIGGLYPDAAVGFAVLGTRGIATAAYRDLEEGTRTTLPVEVRGEWTFDEPVVAPRADGADSTVDRERFDRSIRALSLDGQQRIADATVAVVGVGGLGSMVVTQLARLGVGEFVLVDPDVVERSNLPRIYGATAADVDRHKVDVVGEHAVEAGSEPDVRGYRERVQAVPNRVLADCDVIISAVDRVSARLHCNEVAVRTLTYLVDGGVSITTDEADHVETERGLVQFVAPGVTGCLDCLGRGDPEQARVEQMSETELEAEIERGYVDGDVADPAPAITPLNGMAASAMTRTVTKLLAGHDEPSAYLRFDGLSDDLTAISTHPSDDCLTCGAGEQLGVGPDTDFDPEQLVSESDSDAVDVAEQSSPPTPIEITAANDHEHDAEASTAPGESTENAPVESPEARPPADRPADESQPASGEKTPASSLAVRLSIAAASFGVGWLLRRAIQRLRNR